MDRHALLRAIGELAKRGFVTIDGKSGAMSPTKAGLSELRHGAQLPTGIGDLIARMRNAVSAGVKALAPSKPAADAAPAVTRPKRAPTEGEDQDPDGHEEAGDKGQAASEEGCPQAAGRHMTAAGYAGAREVIVDDGVILATPMIRAGRAEERRRVPRRRHRALRTP